MAGWSKLYGRPISEKEYDEICVNLKNYFETLYQWDKEDKAKQQAKDSQGIK